MNNKLIKSSLFLIEKKLTKRIGIFFDPDPRIQIQIKMILIHNTAKIA